MKQHLINGGDVTASLVEDAKTAAANQNVANTTALLLLQKWYRDHRVIVMHLNNGTLQVCLSITRV